MSGEALALVGDLCCGVGLVGWSPEVGAWLASVWGVVVVSGGCLVVVGDFRWVVEVSG